MEGTAVFKKHKLIINFYRLAAVNFFLGVVGVVQCSRIIMWHQSQKNLPATEELKEKAEEKVEAVKAAVKSQ